MRMRVIIQTVNGEVMEDFVVTDGPNGEDISEEKAKDLDRVRFSSRITEYISNRFNVEEVD